MVRHGDPLNSPPWWVPAKPTAKESVDFPVPGEPPAKPTAKESVDFGFPGEGPGGPMAKMTSWQAPTTLNTQQGGFNA